MSLRARRAALVSLVAVLVLAAAGLTAWRLVPQGPDRISAEELRGDPPIVFVWADAMRAKSTASGDLYVVQPGGTGARRVKAWERRGHVYGTYDARWSPDRKLIALNLSVWEDDPIGHVAVVTPDGRVLRKLARESNPVSDVSDVAWSPDGRALVYTSSGELWTVSPESGKRTRIFNSDSALRYGADWAPDGRHVAAGTLNGIVKVSPDGTKLMKLTRGDDRYPVWSPDGHAIAFFRARYEDFLYLYDVYVVGSAGQGLRRLVSNASHPLWSRNGRSILFTEAASAGSDERIGLIESDGRDRRTLTSGSARAWSPDGSRILFERQPGRRSELWVMDADGERQTRLLAGRPGWVVITTDWGR